MWFQFIRNRTIKPLPNFMEIHAFVVGLIHLWRCELASLKLFCNYVWLLVMPFYCLNWRRRCSVWLCIRGIYEGKLRRRAQQIPFSLALEGYLPSVFSFRMFRCFRNPDFRWISCVWVQSLNVSFPFWGNKLSPSKTHPSFIICPTLLFSLSFVVLEIWGSTLGLWRIPAGNVQIWFQALVPCAAVWNLLFPHLSLLTFLNRAPGSHDAPTC